MGAAFCAPTGCYFPRGRPQWLRANVLPPKTKRILILTFTSYLPLAGLTVFTLIVNLPFGFLRSKAKKFSFPWFLYIHLPIPFVYVLRRLLMLPMLIIPLLLVAAIVGQVWGGRIRTERKSI